jgi:PTH1 family peptidyl-tRNA hydrolase
MKYLIVGLGNIGAEYDKTRHNIGFMAIDAFAKSENTFFETARYGSIAHVKHKGRILILLKPSTYMNLSGKAVQYWLQKENISIENTLVIVDDIDLEVGTLRLKSKGGGGSHNGLNHIIEILGSESYPRLRFGIGKNYSMGKQVDYVLGQFTPSDLELINPKIAIVGDIIKSFVTIGIERTMNFFNKNK